MTDAYAQGIREIDGLNMLADPDLTIINFGAERLDIFLVPERMAARGWLPGLTREPKGLHAMLSGFHETGREDYLRDLRQAVSEAAGLSNGGPEIEPVY